ncbi:hypothetical protein SY88_04260 [Clostridiales bacterium PH28_bin88]|nr:hypothetical protein SY88_04260 [Clostridiales bacterium PH28_bin88]
MSREKIGTSINRNLITHVRVLSRRTGQPLNEIIEEALEQYLARTGFHQGNGLVRATKGVIPANPDLVKAILEEEPFLEI